MNHKNVVIVKLNQHSQYTRGDQKVLGPT